MRNRAGNFLWLGSFPSRRDSKVSAALAIRDVHSANFAFHAVLIRSLIRIFLSHHPQEFCVCFRTTLPRQNPKSHLLHKRRRRIRHALRTTPIVTIALRPEFHPSRFTCARIGKRRRHKFFQFFRDTLSPGDLFSAFTSSCS